MLFSYIALNALGGALYPVFLAGFLHTAYVALVSPGALPSVAGGWGAAILAAAALSYAAWRALYLETSRGRYDRLLRRQARARFERNRRLTMIEDSEFIAAYAPLAWKGGPGVLLLTDSRLVCLSFRPLWRKAVLVTDCDRLAIKSIAVREAASGVTGWIHGRRYARELVVEVVGVKDPQVFVCVDHGSVDVVVRRLESQPRLPPVQNGIRRIHHLRHRNALKRAYVRSFHPPHRPAYLRAGLLALLWPGLGQMALSRARTGLMLAGGFAVLVAGAVTSAGASAIEPGILVGGVLTWLLGILDVLVQRQIGAAESVS